MKVLFVCTGNLCRSPMAEGLLRHELDSRGCHEVEVVSGGTWAHHGSPATDGANRVLLDRGIDLSAHLSRPVGAEDLEDADLIVAMTSVHLQEIAQTAPDAPARTRLLKELVELSPDLEAGSTSAKRLQALLDAPRPEPRRALDVDDPIGLPLSAYERCAGELERSVKVLADVLCPAPDK